ncbi:MAG: hypothetical protein SGILL_010788, partial [Bacillariaceae sp.]
KEETMSRSSTPTQRYGDIIGKVLSSSASDATSTQGKQAVEESLSALHSARKNQFNHVETSNSVSEQAKRMFREKRLQISPGRSLSRPTTPERREDRRHRFQFRELRDEESIRRFSRSPARRKELEKAANRALQSNRSNGSVSEATSISASSRATTSRSPPRRRGYSDYGTTDRDTRLPLPPSAPYNIEKDKEIVTLRNELKELQEHLMKALESEQLLEKRADKKQRAAQSVTVAMEELQKTVQVQAEQIKFYESCLKERDTEVEQLTHSLRRTEAKCAKVELDLESHDLKFSIYDDYRRLMDRERLDGKNDGDSDEDESRLGDDDFERAVRSNQENA